MSNNSIPLNPIFEPLQQPETIQAHMAEKIEELKRGNNPFPLEAFPQQLQDIIRATKESLNFPVDFTAASMLFAASVAIGNTHRVKVREGWTESAAMYLVIVGRAGTTKSHPLSFINIPLDRRDTLTFRQYQEEKRAYDAFAALSKADREAHGSEPSKPALRQFLVSDFTIEALIEVMKHNRRGIGVYADELAAWVNNFNRYNKGSEEEFWLSNWSGKTIRTNRKTSEPNLIDLPFISVCGAIQPGILNTLADGRTENGFMDRILFALPDNLKKECWNEKELNPAVAHDWQTILSRLMDMEVMRDEAGGLIPKVLNFSPDAKARLFAWQRQCTMESNSAANDAVAGIYAKLEVYAVRLALILEMLHLATGSSTGASVGIDAVNGSLQLIDYFKHTAVKVNDILNDDSPVKKLNQKQQAVYKALPDQFTTGEGVLIAAAAGMPERTFKRFLKKGELFQNDDRGQYEKLF